MIETVRGFNRIVTRRVGALQNSYLARDRTLTESRVLWEIASAAATKRLPGALKLHGDGPVELKGMWVSQLCVVSGWDGVCSSNWSAGVSSTAAE